MIYPFIRFNLSNLRDRKKIECWKKDRNVGKKIEKIEMLDDRMLDLGKNKCSEIDSVTLLKGEDKLCRHLKLAPPGSLRISLYRVIGPTYHRVLKN